jgi:hypothetical protein
MKKTFKMAALAALVMGFTTACNQTNNQNDSVAPDTTPVVAEDTTPVVAEDTVAMEEQQPVEEKATVKKTTKKTTAKKAEEPIDVSKKTAPTKGGDDQFIKNQQVNVKGSDIRKDNEKKQIANQNAIGNANTKKK